jgi:hypothetical protein
MKQLSRKWASIGLLCLVLALAFMWGIVQTTILASGNTASSVSQIYLQTKGARLQGEGRIDVGINRSVEIHILGVSGGSYPDITDQVTFSFADSSIAKIENGKIYGLKLGSTTVKATYGEVSTSFTVCVDNVIAAAAAKVFDSAGNAITPANLAYNLASTPDYIVINGVLVALYPDGTQALGVSDSYNEARSLSWNTDGYELMGWSVAGCEPILGEVEFGSSLSDKYANHPLAKFLKWTGKFDSWNFSAWVGTNNLLVMNSANMELTGSTTYYPIFRLKDGYDYTTPLAGDGNNAVASRLNVEALTEKSFTDAKLMNKTEEVHGNSIYDLYEVKVQAEKDSFSFDIPMPEQGADAVRIDNFQQGTTITREASGDVIHVTVKYTDSSFLGVYGYSYNLADTISVYLNVTESDNHGTKTTPYLMYKIQYYRESVDGVSDGQYKIKVNAQNRTFDDAGAVYDDVESLAGKKLIFGKAYSALMYEYWNDDNAVRLAKIIVNNVEIPIPSGDCDETKSYTIPGCGTQFVIESVMLEGSAVRSLRVSFSNPYPTRDMNIDFVFEELKPQHKFSVTSGNSKMGTIQEVHLDKTDASGNDTYSVIVNLKQGYAVGNITANGSTLSLEPVSSDWVYESVLEGSGWSSEPTDFLLTYNVTVNRDTNLTFGFKPWDYNISLLGYAPEDYPSDSVGYNIEYMDYMAEQKPLYSYIKGAHVYMAVATDGWFAKDYKTTDDNSIQVYGGKNVNAKALLASYDSFEMRGSQGLAYVSFSIPNVSDYDEFTVVMTRNGKKQQATFQVETILSKPGIKELFSYYQNSFGNDKFGASAYTAAEKKTAGYKTYLQYARMRIYLRSTLENALDTLLAADDYQSVLSYAKEELQLAAEGVGGYTVVSNIPMVMTAVVAPNEELGLRGDISTGMTAMTAVLEAGAPANWSFKFSNDGLVRGVSAGNAEDTGRISYQNTGLAGFWYLNGEYALIGVPNYVVQDGDICTWGGAGGGGGSQEGVAKSEYSQAKVWNIACVASAYSQDELKALAADRGLLTAAANSEDYTASDLLNSYTAEEIKQLFPEVDYRRFGRNSEGMLSSLNRVKTYIAELYPISGESKARLVTARQAYEALSDEDKRLLASCGQYKLLTRAEDYYNLLTTVGSVDMEKAQELLNSYSGTASEIRTFSSMLAIVSAAQNGSTPDNAVQTAQLLSTFNNELDRKSANYFSNLSLKYGKEFYGRIVIELTAMGYNASAYLDSNGHEYNFIDYLKDYDNITSGGVDAVAWTLIALDSKPYDNANTELRQRYVQWLLANQLPSGAWGANGKADPDSTAAAMIALSKYQTTDGVSSALADAASALKNFQTEYGSFYDVRGYYNMTTTSMVVIALSSIGMDAATWVTANGSDPIGALLNVWSDSNKLFQTDFTDVGNMGMEPVAALLAYTRYTKGEIALFDLREQFGESYLLQIQGENTAEGIVAEPDEDTLTAAIQNAVQEGALSIRLQISATVDEQETDDGYSDWEAVNENEINDSNGLTAVTAKRYVLNLSANIAKLMAESKLGMVVETPLAVITMDCGTVSEIGSAAENRFVMTVDATESEYTKIMTYADDEEWSSGSNVNVSIPVAVDAPGLVIALVDGDEEEIFWKTTVIRHALSADVKLPAVLRVYTPLFAYGDMAEDSRFAGAAKFAAARDLFDDDGFFDENEAMTLNTILRALYQLEGAPKIETETVQNYSASDGFVALQTKRTENDVFADMRIYLIKKDSQYNDIVIWAFENDLIPASATVYDGSVQIGIDDPLTGEHVSRHVIKDIDTDVPITRVQVASVMAAYAKYLGLDVSYNNKSDLSVYEDYTRNSTVQWHVSDSGAKNLAWAVYNGVIEADENGRLDPNGVMKKGDFAKMLQAISINASGGVRGNDGNSDESGEVGVGTATGTGTPGMPVSGAVVAEVVQLPEQVESQQQNQQELQEEQPPEEEPEQQEQPEENLEVDKDVTRVTQDNSLSAMIPIVGACVLIGGAAVIMLKRRKK